MAVKCDFFCFPQHHEVLGGYVIGGVKGWKKMCDF
jgi:hypothetical protein